MFLWSICFPLIALGLPFAPHLTFASLRGLLAGIMLLILALIMKRPQPQDGKTWLYLVAIGLGATTLGFFGMFHASEFVSPGIATVIANTQPLMAAALASFFLNEHLNRLGKLGIFIGFLGIVVISIPALNPSSNNLFGLGLIYIILAAIGITISNVLIRHIAKKIDALSAMAWQLILGSLFLAAIALSIENVGTITWNTKFIASLIGLALPGTALAYWLWCDILSNVELNRANAFSFLVPIFGLILGAIFFNESVDTLSLVGFSLILLGIIIVNWPTKNIALK